MSTLSARLREVLTPELELSIGQALGLDRSTVQVGMAAVAPLVVGALARLTSTPAGRDALMLKMPQVMATLGKGDVSGLLAAVAHGGGNQDMMSSLMGMLTGASVGGHAAISDMIHGLLVILFGDGLGAAGGTIDRALGSRASALLAVAAPMMVAQVGAHMREHALAGDALAALVQEAANEYATVTPDGAQLAETALEAGRQAQALEQRFAPGAWAHVRMAPLAAAAVVMAAAPSGTIGSSQEIQAMMAGIERVKATAAPTALLSVAFDAPMREDELATVTGSPPLPQLLAIIRQAVVAVGESNGEALPAYRAAILEVAGRVAAAAREGGFLGMGGQQVSEAEKTAILAIEKALTVSAK